MRPMYLVYDNGEVESQPDLDEFEFTIDGRSRYVKVGHNLLSHSKGDKIRIEDKLYVVDDVIHSYSTGSHGDFELSNVNVVLKEVN